LHFGILSEVSCDTETREMMQEIQLLVCLTKKKKEKQRKEKQIA